jgi:hypothetical protein
MATDKRFAVAGTSTQAGDTKVRFANDMMRIKILQKNGHTNINLVELPSEMTKSEAVAYLRSIEFGKGNADVESALTHVEKKNPAAVSKPATKAPKAKAKVAATSDEDAPF